MSEINPARLRLKSGVENEADDEGTETDCGGDRRSLWCVFDRQQAAAQSNVLDPNSGCRSQCIQ